MIGFDNNSKYIYYRTFINILINNIDDWLLNSSDLVKREYVAGYMNNKEINLINNYAIQILNDFNIPLDWKTSNENISKYLLL
jgi:hypothetical protein